MDKAYRLLPFRFRRLGKDRLLVNDLGQFCLLSPEELEAFVQGHISQETDRFAELQSKDFLWSDYTADLAEAYADKYRTKKKFLFDSTALHILVVTHRCNQSCLYCHASAGNAERRTQDGDMPPQTAKRCVELAWESPSRFLKLEFQGGEPSLNFSAIQAAVLHAETLASIEQKDVEYVICTNLFHISSEHLVFFQKHNVAVSTSLDGPQPLHDACRLSGKGEGTYADVVDHIAQARSFLGKDKVSALLTVTKHNLDYLPRVIDEYIEQGFSSIFIRMLNPFGRAVDSGLGYSGQSFVKAYKDALDYIIALNKQHIYLVEEFAAILLGRILTPFSCGFMDLQSPTGAALSGIVYETNGDVFVSDEARMHWMVTGDKYFCLGNVGKQNRAEIYASDHLRKMVSASVAEVLPACAWCAYLPYCGSDPVRNFALTGDMVGFKPGDTQCQVLKAVFDDLFGRLLSGDESTQDVFWSWITRRRYGDVALRTETS